MTIKTQLVDVHNLEEFLPTILEEISSSDYVGLDCETHDDDRHEGLMKFCGYSPTTRKKTTKGKLVFDVNRTTMTGFSIFPDLGDTTYYFNLNHADIENRIPWEKVICVFEHTHAQDKPWVCHNAPYEITMFKKCYGLDLKQVVCSMQLAVTAYGPDEYSDTAFHRMDTTPMKYVLTAASRHFKTFDPHDLSNEQGEIINKFLGKQSRASHSYNGMVGSIAYGYGLKQAIKSWFNIQMTTFEECLGDNAHMGELTGAEVCAYGAEDAYWCVKLYHVLLAYLMDTNPAVIPTFFEQENPMIYVYAEAWGEGINLDTDAVLRHRDIERTNFAQCLRDLKQTLGLFLPLKHDPPATFRKYSPWYDKNPDMLRNKILNWLKQPNSDDDYTQCRQVSGAVSTAWGPSKASGPNLGYWREMRVVFYDFLQLKVVFDKDQKVQSDGACQGKLLERLNKLDPSPERDAKIKALTLMKTMASIEQRMKLYLTPYLLLTDPDTGRIYPTISSRLASRRMASVNPNTMQLSKKGESTYIRGFIHPDQDDHVIISRDWSSVELVEIGDFSGDPEFAKAFKDIPYQDLHAGAAAGILGVSEEEFSHLKFMGDDEVPSFPLVTPKGEKLTPRKYYKEMRTVLGKGANFNYWYSGYLSSIGETMGWQWDQMMTATEKYRNRFKVAEQWRVNLISEGVRNGHITLPDHHRRVRFEATPRWAQQFRQKFESTWGKDEGVMAFLDYCIRKIQNRAKNQLVNSSIQGSCATLAKRTILKMRNEVLPDMGWGPDMVRFMLPVHDELVYSVHKSIVVPFSQILGRVMCEHPDIIKTLKLHSTASIGRTFEPFNDKTAKQGQIELDEAPRLPCLSEKTFNKALNDNEVAQVVKYLFA